MMLTIIMLSKIFMSSLISMILTIYLNNIFNSPSMLLIYLISYSIYMSLMMFTMYSMNSLLILMILIVFLSGMLVMFSYFISLINEPLKLKMKPFIQTLFLIIITMKIYNKLSQNEYYFNYFKNIDLMYLYMKMNSTLFFIMILMLIITLILMTKITYIEKKTLRKKK
uniref:NADH dehydrogenase subunit 6 n=4 Tax=Apis mellifera TaxID=7460 RepID=A0A291LR94_APIME|nr:NADH dehydrogenase subunit 6 [Apis mellifera sahariensis]AIS39003.1 NADH dehydrogenase subunit 6 [Apis mellifera intermissa]ASV72124.1 NADH dehydrogenase subunit 6 [Apis mellifera sahariensis]ATI24718.1 NADH dehydrogenase subunit 6 [Apis mellifera]UHM24677.1 NADH dehydrogenase subunit 6 [Apis mellifera siciliana]